MPEIIDLDELVPEDIVFKYRSTEYTIPGDLRTDQTLELFALLQRLAAAESTGKPGELKRIIGQTEAALLPIFQVHQPEMEKLPFGAAGLGLVLRRVLWLIGLLQIVEPGDEEVDPPTPAPLNRAARRRTQTTTKPGSRKPKKTAATKSGGSSRSKS